MGVRAGTLKAQDVCRLGASAPLDVKVMTHFYSLYASWRIKDSYFNKMLHCGENYNRWVEIALQYLPENIFNEQKERLAFFSTGEVDACRVTRQICKEREIILLSERILPKAGVNEVHETVRYYVFVVLHEVAHAIRLHKSPLFDSLTQEEIKQQEKEADDLAMTWFNEHVKIRNNPHLKPITIDEVREAQNKNQKMMENLYKNV